MVVADEEDATVAATGTGTVLVVGTAVASSLSVLPWLPYGVVSYLVQSRVQIGTYCANLCWTGRLSHGDVVDGGGESNAEVSWRSGAFLVVLKGHQHTTHGYLVLAIPGRLCLRHACLRASFAPVSIS